MVTYKNKSILIDGKPVFLLSGELHYYRRPQKDWQHLINEAKEMGLNCIATYVPWILHEEEEGCFNFEDRLDLGAFIDLCAENDLYVFIRPGPYIMAEMKKEGIPYWVTEKYPDALPTGFHGEKRDCNTVDYLNPNYLNACFNWYRRVMQIIVPRLQSKGGNIIGVQLDNEIGMLNWVTNFPVMNDSVLENFHSWLKNEYKQELNSRYPSVSHHSEFLSPKPLWEAEFHLDYGRFMRDYYAEYTKELYNCAKDCGVEGVPFFINIHGTGDSRIFDFPLGVSQLYKAYTRFDDIISGTDVYLGEPNEFNYQDMYVCNAVTAAMNGDRPLTSIEFQCSDGPYCNLSGIRIHPTSAAHQLLMNVSQDARMINFYVFSGGENYPLKFPRNDGDDRMAFTGELHGTNAPVNSENKRNYCFPYLARAAAAIHAVPGLAGSAFQQRDDLVLGFIPDYFLTELQDPRAEKTADIFRNLRANRCAGAIDSVVRGLLGAGLRFTGEEINSALTKKEKTVLILSAKYMPRDVQSKIVAFVKAGGRVLIYGELPEFDLEGNPCTLLLEGLGLEKPTYEDTYMPAHYVLFKSTDKTKGIITDIPGTHAQCFKADQTALLTSSKGTMCAFEKQLEKGKLVAVTCDFPGDYGFWKNMLGRLGVTPSISHTEERGGVYISKSTDENGQGFIVILNLDAQEKTTDITVDGKLLFKDLFLTEKRGMLLPLNVKLNSCIIESSTAEFLGEDDKGLHFGLTQKSDVIVLKTKRSIKPQKDIEIERSGDLTTVRVNKDARTQKEIILIQEEENEI